MAIQEALELVTWASSQDSGLEEKNWKVPVVLFPQGAAALSPAADAITFMMLMNSKSPRYLIEEQVAGSLYIKKPEFLHYLWGILFVNQEVKQERWVKPI